MELHAHGELYHRIDVDPGHPLPDLKDYVTDAVGQSVRRISRFMQLAIIGAGRCARGQSLPQDTAVYLASSRGDLEISVDVMNGVFREGLSPKPLSFVNTVSNSAAFYIAKCLRLESRSAFVCSRYFAFENALQLALLDMRMGLVSSALVGSVDSAVLPMGAHRERLEVDVGSSMAEGSHWLWVTQEKANSLGTVIDVVHASDRGNLRQAIVDAVGERRDVALSQGQSLNAAAFAEIQTDLGVGKRFDYLHDRDYYASQCGAAIANFVERGQASTLVHVNGDPLGRYMAIVFTKSK